jgi:hypothetical protein
MKKADLEKNNAAKIRGDMRGTLPPERFAGGHAIAATRREQRELDRAKGLIPFAVKLEGELVKKVQAYAQAKNEPLNDAVAALLKKGLEGQA